MDKQNSLLGFIVSAIISGGIFFTFLFILSMSYWWAALLIAVGTYIGLTLLLTTGQKNHIAEALKMGEQNIFQLQSYANRLHKSKMQSSIYSLSETARGIYKYLKKNPANIQAAHATLSYYFQTTFKIMDHYIELHDKQISPQIEQAITKSENALGTITDAFKKQLEKLLHDNIFDLDIEIETLEA